VFTNPPAARGQAARGPRQPAVGNHLDGESVEQVVERPPRIANGAKRYFKRTISRVRRALGQFFLKPKANVRVVGARAAVENYFRR
jgi:hypothetical protein